MTLNPHILESRTIKYVCLIINVSRELISLLLNPIQANMGYKKSAVAEIENKYQRCKFVNVF